MARAARPRLAVWKFASCDGCQLSLLDCEDELLAVAAQLDIAYFAEASRRMLRGPYDLSLVEGSITTPADAERILRVRRLSRHLVTIGACATAGGIQALRNFADAREFAAYVYPHPEYLQDLGNLDADQRARAGRLRIARLPDRQGPAARGHQGIPDRPQAGDRRPQCLHGLQGARQCLRDGRARDPLSRARSPTPAAARSVRLTIAAAMAASGRSSTRTPRQSQANSPRSEWRERDVARVFQTFNAAAEAFRKEAEAHGD